MTLVKVETSRTVTVTGRAQVGVLDSNTATPAFSIKQMVV